MNEKQSFFEKLTGAAPHDDSSPEHEPSTDNGDFLSKEENTNESEKITTNKWLDDTNNREGQLTVDVYQTPTHIVVQAPMAGVKPDDIDVSINNDMITIRGKRPQKSDIGGDDYYYRELFWGPFSRSVLMPSEVDSNRTEASFKNGLLTVKMAKVNKEGVEQIKIQTKEI